MEENTLTAPQKIIVIGGSAGSLEAILKILPKLDHIDTIAIVLVLHRRNSDDNVLEELLRMKSNLNVKEVEDKTPIKAGRIYVAPPDYHLLFEDDLRFALDVSEKVNYSRPSIDVAFESAAEVFGNKLVTVLLSGANSDGTAGLKIVKEYNGTAVVQSPETADVPIMPEHAIKHIQADHILSPAEIAGFIRTLL